MHIGLELTEAGRIAVAAIQANRGRSALTALGIIIGIIAVTTTMTAANGLQNTFRQSFSSVGTDVIYVTQMPWVMMNDFFQFRNRPRLEMAHAERLKERLTGHAVVNPSLDLNRPIKFQSGTMDGVNVIGTTDRYTLFSDVSTDVGRFMSPFDVRFHRRVAVIGSEVAERLFGNVNPINKELRVGRYDFRVIGVMQKQGGGFMGGPNFDRQVYLPISTFINAFGDRNNNVDIAVKAPDTESVEDLEYRVIGEMRRVRGLRPGEREDFSINKLDSLVGAYNSTMGVVVLIGLVITGISLFVGGVGVMNIMFVSITERTREIGIRKAIGARPRSILLQFLLESSLICLTGGLIGVALSWLIAMAINATLMPASLSLPIIIIALLVSLGTGVASGLVPAIKGARLDPIESLRYE